MPSLLKMKSKLDMTALFNRLVVRGSSCPGHGDHAEVIEWAPSSESSEEEEEEDQRELQKGKKQQQPMAAADTSSIPTRYSLRSGLLRRSLSSNSRSPAISSSSCSRRSKLQPPFYSASSNCNSLSRTSSPPSASLQIWNMPSTQQSDQVKTLLSELASRISALKAAFGLMRASSTADACSRARKAMAEELQTLSDLHTRLFSLIDRHDSGMNQDISYEAPSTNDSSASRHSLQGQDAKLKSYERIITRFHDELQKKDAVIEALKETLAKSILKGEKLERRIRALQAKLSSLL